MTTVLRDFAAAGTIVATVVVGCTSLPTTPRSLTATGGAGLAGSASGGIGGKTIAPGASGGQAGGWVAATGGGAGGMRPPTESGGATGSGGGGRGAGGIAGTGGGIGSGGISASGGAGGGVPTCQVNATQCATNGLQTCGTNGQWGMAVPCGPHQTCGGAVGPAKCTCNVDPVCKGVGKTCASTTMLAACMQDAQSCSYAASTSTCTTGACAGAAGAAACSCASCTAGVMECLSSTSLGSCAAGPNSCNVQNVTACGAGLVCGRLAPASCADPRWAEWPVPSTAPTGYTDNADGTVTDSVTGLMWEKTGTTTAMTQPAAVTYCATMATTGGHSDWRLPSRIELVSIVDYGRNPRISPLFTGTASSDYWSSTSSAENSSFAWFVHFGNGSTDVDDTSGMGNVRCVR